MAISVLAVSAALPGGLPMVALLGIKVAVGGLAYAAAIWLLFRANVMALVRVLKQVRQRAVSTPAPAGAGQGT
jgi:hypothetical protein